MKKIFALVLTVGALAGLVLIPAHADESEILSKMNTLEEQQEKILQTLDEIKAELNVVKVRVTQGQ